MEIPQFPVNVRWTAFSFFLLCIWRDKPRWTYKKCVTPWKSYALHSAEVPKVFLDDALDTLMTTPVQAAAADKEQIKRRKEWRFLCLELVEDDLDVTLDFCVDTYVVKID